MEKTGRHDSIGSVFSFGDFDRMQEELNFKGNFYEKVKRKSLVMRESLESCRLRERTERDPKNKTKDVRMRNLIRRMQRSKEVQNKDIESMVRLGSPNTKRRRRKLVLKNKDDLSLQDPK